jgi:hypothetical protein
MKRKISATSIPCTDNRTIWVRRQVTTEPDERRTIRNKRFPSSFEISRTRRPYLDKPAVIGMSATQTGGDKVASATQRKGASNATLCRPDGSSP